MTKIESFLKRSPLYPALVLENYFSYKKRRLLINTTKYLVFSIPLIIICTIIIGNYNPSFQNTLSDTLITKLIGLTLLSLSFHLLMQMFEAYFSSIYYFEYVAKNRYQNKELYTFSAGRILRRVENDNLLTGFLKSKNVGRKIIGRLGISESEITELLLNQKEVKNPPIFDTNQNKLLKVADLVEYIYKNYADFRKLLTDHGLTEKDLLETVDWTVYRIESEAYDRQWWRADKLARIPGVATDWSFGRTYLLSKYSRNIANDKEVNSDAEAFYGRERELEQIQTILNRPAGANALLVGQPGQEKMEVIWNLARKTKGKKILLFTTNSFSSTIKDKYEFENKLNTIFSEAGKAGNVIMIIDDLARLIIQAKQFGLSLPEILDPYLAGIGTQIIALAETEYFHTLIENDKNLMSRFEVVIIKPLLLNEIIKIIARETIALEQKNDILFTHSALTEIAKSADYYFPDGVSSDKAEDLLAEISPWAVTSNIKIIGKEEVLKYVGEKTDIPISNISTDEKEKLLNLENLLMKRVVAQREAVFAVANAIRRSRAGIRNENRPIGSFLFLGPTGVGKTETAKALAEVFFGDEKLLLRLDMSEYQNEESLARLIGSITQNKTGLLANLLKEHPYGVLLLDEFEKTNKEVLNLFLQIIDEGYFTDVYGKKIMARNIIFIATSNAGAEKIFEIISQGKKLKDYETEIIAEIIEKGYFKPELINRFDATVLFHPLSKEDLFFIAKLMLKKVADRLVAKGITLSLDKDLIDFVVRGGYNPTFGARPMNRLIQDTVEQHLADLIIRNELLAGQTITFKVLDQAKGKDSLKPIVS